MLGLATAAGLADVDTACAVGRTLTGKVVIVDAGGAATIAPRVVEGIASSWLDHRLCD